MTDQYLRKAFEGRNSCNVPLKKEFPLFPVASLGLHGCNKDDKLFCLIKSSLVIAKCFSIN